MRLWRLLWLLAAVAADEHLRDLEISEGVPVGTRVGFIGDGFVGDSGPPYLIVPVTGSAVDTDLSIEQNTGEIRTKVPLDRETRSSYSLVAIPLSGENVRVVVRVIDENDNAPTFPSSFMSIEFPENTPRDVKRTLNAAKDLDLGIYNTQRYNIVSGNTNSAFRLSSHREKDGVLYLDLQINGVLDRETIPEYSLVIEALDGGTPPLRGSMTVNVTIQDVNDNQPIFNQSRYFASVPENATIGTSIFQVFATDADAGANGEVEYSINRRQSDKDGHFNIDPKTGLIFVNKALDFETKEVHELVVVARDKGLQPLETTAFVSIKVTDVNDNQPTINVIFLSDDATPKISEIAQPGEFVARISVNDPDSKTEYSNVNVTLEGGEGHFGLATQDNIIYLVIVSLPIDREQKPNYTLSVIATDTGSPPLHASKTFELKVTDVNDNAPEFEQSTYYANVLEVAEPGTSVFQISAFDRDEGINSVISYSLRENADNHPSWFQIDSKSGLITMKSNVDCETDPVPKLTVIATDNGVPALSSSATVLVTIHDVNDNEPIFDQSFYNVTIPENKPKGSCILKVSASDPDCGVNAMVNYTLGDSGLRTNHFYMKSVSGEICISQDLDYESRSSFEFPVVATDRGGLSTTVMVRIQVTDVNDNEPIFNPVEYNVSLRDDIQTTTPFAVVLATDRDSDRFGTISYKIVSGKDANLFRIDRSTGELFVTRGNFLTRSSSYHINVSAMDGGGNKCSQDAQVTINMINSHMPIPLFQQSTYSFVVPEDVFKNSVVGIIKAVTSDNDRSSSIRYTIHSGDPEGLFTLDSSTGSIRTAATLDHETTRVLLLSVQASSRSPPLYSYAQVKITIEDRNDNAPEFESSTIRLSVPESAALGIPLYTVAAKDKDIGNNGKVSYHLVSGNFGDSRLFAVDQSSGHLTLVKHLDYETSQRHTIVVSAADQGDPPMSSNLTVLLEVQDVNDNPPVFERSEYFVSVSEALPAKSQIVQVTAVDLDTGNNARITYKLMKDDKLVEDTFHMMPNTGWLSLKQPMDRETRDKFLLKVAACDNGSPVSTAFATVTITVLDANDNDPKFSKPEYEFSIEENMVRGTVVGSVKATDLDLAGNAAIRYSLIPSNSSFQINPFSGEISTREPLDREARSSHELVAEARDQGSPARSSRVAVKVSVTDVNDNAPELVDPQEDVISVREEQPAGTEVVRARAVDKDEGSNATISYSILKGRDTDGYGVFTIDPISGVIRTKTVLDHEERSIYRIAVAATDNGFPSRQTVRLLRVEVLDLNDNRPTFTSSSLLFRIKEDVPIGFTVGNVVSTDATGRAGGGHVMYSLSLLSPTDQSEAFDIDKSSGSLVVARQLDREKCSEYKLEVRALDTSTSSNPQSSAVAIKIEIVDVNDNAPRWDENPLTLSIDEDTLVGSSLWNLTARDADDGSNGELRYSLVRQYPEGTHFSVDHLTGTLTLLQPLDYETVTSYVLVVKVTDQASNVTERLSSTVTVKVLVKDVNDNSPVFVSPTGPGSAVYMTQQTRVGSLVTKLTAVDKDKGEYGRVSYAISGGNEDTRFQLDPDKGTLTLARALSEFDPKFRAVLNITATDHGVPAKSGSLVLTVLSEMVSSTVPTFLSPNYHANVSEDAIPGTYIIKVAARSPSSYGHNLTYFIPPGVAQDMFKIDSDTGVITLARPLDRETADQYQLVVHVTDSKSGDYDTGNVLVRVLDVNDNAPQFKSGSCYSISIPENTEVTKVHTYIATDLDLDQNAQIMYSITGGNLGNKFHIDPHTGELSARPLDRESQAKYHLIITAQDKGSNPGPLIGTCNSTIIVEDQNDNNPIFPVSQYSLSVPEDVPVGTVVQVVTASDADLGINSRLVFSLSNETDASFHIDNTTGAITTTTLFDRESRSSYYFLVVATDGGRYDRRSARVPVHILIEDVNDNPPQFTRYPFTVQIPSYTQPGQDVLRISAVDNDEGANAEIVYKFVFESPNNKFRINPNTGQISATTSLVSENGKYFGLEVMATDKGNPQLSATGLVEIRVGEMGDNAPVVKFQNASYTVTVPENMPNGNQVLQVSAFKSDGRRQRITYSFGSGNEANMFDLGRETGIIRVRDSRLLDYELHQELSLVVVAQVDNGLGSSLYGYAPVRVVLTDQNDNVPLFTQNIYTASVLEGKNKGTFVVQVAATDADKGSNARLAYHIVDGNHDNAFVIEPAFSGSIQTNIVLDREIRDSYRLTVIVTDEGLPQLTGTAMVKINIIDINDNQPTFPPHSSVKISENKAVGSVLTAVTANDVDTYPPLTYTLLDGESSDTFCIDEFSGRLLLRQPLDYESVTQYRLAIAVSDMAHVAQTVLTISVVDANDNAPVFSQQFYQASIPDLRDGEKILTVNATDLDSGVNALLHYSVVNPSSGGGFIIDEKTGDIYANRSSFRGFSNQGIFDFVVKVQDSGTPSLSSTVPVRIYVENIGGRARLKFTQDEFRISVREDTPRGTVILKVASSGLIDETSSYDIISGDERGQFLVNSKTGELLVVKDLDRESQDSYKLWISSGPNSSTALVNIIIEDANDNVPTFLGVETALTLSEGVPVGHTILKLTATDVDLPPNSDVRFEITSGNEEELFALDPVSGVLSVQQTLDYDTGIPEHLLILKVEDGGKPPLDTPLSSITHLKITLQDENDNAPKFPISEYLEFVGENEPIGSSVFTARATDLDKGDYGKLNYSIMSSAASGYTDVDDSWKLFRVDAATGLVTTNAVFDYETRTRYAFSLQSTDSGGRTCRVKVRVEIESRDEFHPQFTERTFKFILAGTDLPVGYVVGHVTATDRDKGPDGRVVYQLTSQHSYFKVNRTTGAVMIKKKLEGLDSGQDISLVITASSGRQGSLTNMSVVEIAVDPLGYIGSNSASVEPSSPSGSWTAVLLVLFFLIIVASAGVFAFLHMKNRRQKKVTKPGLSNPSTSENNYVDPGTFDTIPIRGSSVGVASPPKYDEIPTYRNNTSELSGSDQSGSSGRGSAEEGDDVEDEEIRMINEGRRKEEDNMSVHNTQEYLARLGIVEMSTSAAPASTDPTHNVFEEPDPDVSTLIYAKLSDGGGEDVVCGRPSMTGSLSSIVHSEEELTGSYNWDYLLDWGPQYQPLAHVFSEIARLKDDAASVKSGASGASSSKSKSKTVPPPLLTNVAPRSIAAARASHLQPQLLLLPRSPISHDPASFPTSAAMSPSFSPSLSPLANRSPSISPLHPPGVPPHHVRQRHQTLSTDNELRI
uniref:Protocadherin-16 n=1 Tax=Cacopsylla melanoneura TaxID=428564 RepID=A0A8D8W2C8_9HEMI